MSPQFKQALVHNLERLNALSVVTPKDATLYATYLKDYAKRGYLRTKKHPGILRQFFLQRVF